MFLFMLVSIMALCLLTQLATVVKPSNGKWH